MDSETTSATSLEAVLELTEGNAEAALRSAGSLTRELRKAKAAAASGQVRELRRAADAAAILAKDLADAVQQTRTSLAIDESSYLASGDYAKELLARAAERGLPVFEEDDRLFCYPSIIRVLPADSVLEIDRKRERRLRPSFLLELLADRQARPTRFRPEHFLESLAKGYDLVVARGGKKADAVVPLQDIWGVLTLLPGQAKEYTRPEFARDLYQLDQSGVQQTKDGRTIRLHASSGTRSAGVLRTVSRSGQLQLYWGVSFSSGTQS
ncbi:MAG: hypothetical protein J2P27_02705 [Actinobacteria bacterium]|nr:hypothetical protein [Actinomycetota bacterium]